MITLIADTETNGLPRGAKTPKGYPDIIQIAGKLVKGEQVIAQQSHFISPLRKHSEVTIPEEKFFIDQGYNTELIRRVGFPVYKVLEDFGNYVRVADRIVFHNANFDWPVILGEYMRNEMAISPLDIPPIYCTLHSLTNVLKIPFPSGKAGNKWPTLDESYRKLVHPDGFEGAHDAMMDVTATHEVLIAMEQREIPLLKATSKWIT